MRALARSAIAAAVAAFLIPALPAEAGGKPKPPPPPPPPIKLEITSPAYKSSLPLGLMYESGTSLDFKATIVGPALGYLSNRVSSYAGDFDTGWFVFADPDSCLEIALSPGTPMGFQRPCLRDLYPQYGDNDYPGNDIIPDETYFQFTNERDDAGSPDGGVIPDSAAMRQALGDPLASGRPEFMALTREFTHGLMVDPPATTSTPIGPNTGGNADDGFGYGTDDDLPGLVVLSARGVGLVYQDADGFPGTKTSNFTKVSPRAQWNLAGFLHSVSYELKGNDGKTAIHAHMTLPDGLVAPIVAYDNCIGEHNGDGSCVGEEHWYRVDGGPVQKVPGQLSAYDFWSVYFPSLTYEVTAFIVSGRAPSQLVDLNNDNKVNAADATLAGYTVLSNETVVRFNQINGFVCTEAVMATMFGLDLDGNGQTNVGINCPPGPGALKGVP